MAMRDDLHSLVDALSDEQAPTALTYLRRLAGPRSTLETDALTERMGPATMSGQDFMTRPPLSASALAAAQGVGPITSVEALTTDLWPTDPANDPDVFVEALRAWRRDEGRA